MSGIFTMVNDFIDGQMKTVVELTQTNVANSVSTILSVSVVAYLTFYGYMILADKVQSPIKSIIWKCVSFAIIIAFIQNAGGVLTLAGEAVEELSTIGSGGNVGLAFLDDQYLRMYDLAIKLWDKGNIFTGAVGFLGVMLAWGFFTVPVFCIFVASKFTMFLLLGFAPLFVFCLMWGWLKQSFSNYLSALLGNALIILVIRTLQKVGVDFFDKFKYNGETAPALTGILLLAVAVILIFLYIHIIKTVEKLMSVTVDQIPTFGLPSANAGKTAQAQKEAQEKAVEKAQQAQRDQVQQQILQQLQLLNKNNTR